MAIKSVSHRGYKNMHTGVSTIAACRMHRFWARLTVVFAVMNEWLYATRITVATMSVLVARGAVFDMALDYAAQRDSSSASRLRKFQGVGFQIADMITEIDAADLADARRCLTVWIKGLPANREIASARNFMLRKCWPESRMPRSSISSEAWG